ncbi:uncharacterized protein BX663DRAFT_550363 [Cokeromyces recurvatus]|uniref:uncharacterized protein n=1 Tax=Cokeromyces recurvatus TaxID=90255 RepID=UPI00221F7096|nr:uncharacterized protein BX663DRAFT_550363 [Cokeromyces recurvatus]KAI7904722.1 hypothetical protein BX663DRAFT_550363 [Cokeromyces recurvatus]
MNLPQEVILRVIDKFLNVKDSINFVTCKKTIWSIAILPRRKALVLKNHSDVIQIRRAKEIIIENRYYHPDFIKHVLKYAINLNHIKFEKANYKIAFIQLFMVINQKCKLTVPATDLNLFQVVVKDNCNEYIDIDTVNHGGKSVKRIKTPEMGINIMKDNLSDILLNHHNNQLFDTEQYSIYNNLHQTNVVLMTFLYIHSQSVDDCADSSRVNAQNEAVFCICKKTRFGLDFFELTVRFSNVELLATSGFYGPIEGHTITPFFGSSIQKLPTSITGAYNTVASKEVFIPTTAKAFTKDVRLLNQYIKTHSARQWMFLSKKFKSKGYIPHHPLSFLVENIVQRGASLLLRAFTYKILPQEEIAEVDSRFKNSVTKLTASGKLVKKYITELNSKDQLIIREYDYVQLKKDMLYIYENILAGAIKKQKQNIGIKS